VTITNTGNFRDSYVLTASDNENWGPILDNYLLENVQPGENRADTLNVTIPENALGNREDNIVVTATSTENTEVSASDSAIAKVSVVRGVDVTISPSLQDGTPGMTLTYTVSITNTGNVWDTYNITFSDNAGWDPRFDLVQVKLAPYGSAVVWNLEVTIPEGAPIGAEDNITVTATSTDNVVTDSDSCIARRSKAEFSLVTLYVVKLDLDITLATGSKLVVKFYTYGNVYENENVFWSGTTPANVAGIGNIPHPENIGTKKVRLDLTTDNTEDVIATIATFTVTRNILNGRLVAIYLEWPFASPERRNVLMKEITDIYLQWPFAPF